MSRRRPRGLRPDEEELWARVAETATPLNKPASSVSRGGKTQPERQKKNAASANAKAPVPSFRVGSKAETAPVALPNPAPKDPFAADPLRMDKRAFDRLKRGKARPDGKIDLHGKTADAARAALTAYVLRAAADGKRLVLVITGKGRQRPDHGVIPERVGILRQSLPQWVSTPPLSSVVLQTTPAHQRHGGAGAFYLYLRRTR